MDFDWEWGFPQLGVFGFVIAIVLIGSIFSYLKSRSAHETIQKLAESGQPIDPEMLRGLEADPQETGRGLVVGGAVTLAVAAALIVFGQQIGAVTGDEQVGPVLRAVAVFPGFIGAALLVTGIASLAMRGKSAREG